MLISQMQSEVSPSSLEFPVTPADETSDPMVVTIKNTGAPTFSLNLVEKTGASANNFSVDLDGCPSSIVAGDECEVAVTFDPSGTQGTFDATLVLSYADGAGQASIPMTGRTPAYMDFVPPNGLEFDETISGYTPDEKTETVVIYSGGGVPLELGTPQLAGPDAADFRIENPTACANPIDFGDHCALDITFAPQANTGGLREANLTFASNNDPTFDKLIPLSGHARRAEFTVSPASFDFGEAKISPTIQRTPQTFTLTSTGPAKVPFTGVQMTGPNADSFLITDNTCPAMIPANDGTCSISVVFDPKFGSASARSATLEVDAFSSVTPGKTLVQLSGTATADPPPVIKPKLTLKLKSPAKVKRGKALVVTAIVKNVGKVAAKPVTIKATVPKRFAKAPKAIKITSLAPGRSVTKKLKIKVRKNAKKGAKIKLKVTASSRGVKKTATRTVRVR